MMNLFTLPFLVLRLEIIYHKNPKYSGSANKNFYEADDPAGGGTRA